MCISPSSGKHLANSVELLTGLAPSFVWGWLCVLSHVAHHPGLFAAVNTMSTTLLE